MLPIVSSTLAACCSHSIAMYSLKSRKRRPTDFHERGNMLGKSTQVNHASILSFNKWYTYPWKQSWYPSHSSIPVVIGSRLRHSVDIRNVDFAGWAPVGVFTTITFLLDSDNTEWVQAKHAVLSTWFQPIFTKQVGRVIVLWRYNYCRKESCWLDWHRMRKESEGVIAPTWVASNLVIPVAPPALA